MDKATLNIYTPDQRIMALSWKEPFATLMLHGKIETRRWPTNYRGWVLICSSKIHYPAKTFHQIMGMDNVFRLLQSCEIAIHPQCFSRIDETCGNAMAIGRLVDCKKMLKKHEEKCFVLHQEDLWCHVYENVQPIEFIPWKGSLGWSEVPEGIRMKIKVINQ